MSYYPEPDSHNRDKVKVVLNLSNYATKKIRTCCATGAKKSFITLKAEVDKLGINILANVPTSLNNLKTKVNDFDIGNLKTVPIDLKKLSDLVDNQVVKNTKFNALNTKVSKVDKKFLMRLL